MLVACPGGCGEALRMPTPAFDGSAVVRHDELHACPVLGPMPDPFDPTALLEWAAGALAPGPLTPEVSTPIVEPVSTATLEKKPKKKRNYLHVPFDTTECPLETCECGPPKGKRTRGKVPGVNRHIWFMHRDRYEELAAKLPPNRTIDGLIAAFEQDEQQAETLIDGLGLRNLLPKEGDWTWEDAAAAVLNKVEER